MICMFKARPIVSWCIWELFKYESWNIWDWSCKISFSSWIRMVSDFKKDKSKTRSFNWYRYVINGKKGTRGRICHSKCWYAKANKKYMKDYDENKESSYIPYWNVNNLYGLAAPQRFPLKIFLLDKRYFWI